MTARQSWEYPTGVVLYDRTRARPYYRIVWREKGGQRKSASAGTVLEHAQGKAAEIDARLASSVGYNGERTISELCEEWLNDQRPHWATSHFDKTRRMADLYILPALENIEAWSLDRASVVELLEMPTSTSTRRHLKAALGSMLTWAYAAENRWVPERREHYMPRQPRTSKRQAVGAQHGQTSLYIDPALIPDAEHCRQLAEAMREQAGPGRRGEAAWLMTAIAASAGLRQGELFALKRRHITISDDIHVRQQVTRPSGGGVELTPPKWGRERTVYVADRTIWGDPLLPVLRAYIADLGPDEVLFPAPRGGYWMPSNFGRRLFLPARAQVDGWDQAGWTWHSLRHAFCSHLIASGATVADVASAAGHRDPNVTLRMYVSSSRGVSDRLRAI